MGVDFSKEAARPPLSIACVAALSEIDAARFHTFRKAIHGVRAPVQARRSSRVLLEPIVLPAEDQQLPVAWRAYDLSIVNYERAIEVSDIQSHDRLVLDRIFAIMDRTGDDIVHSLELLIAMAMLAHAPFESKLELAVTCLIDGLNDKPLAPTHLVFLVSTMTTVANYFGDPLLPLPVLENIADDAFDELTSAADFDPYKPPSRAAASVLVHALATHPFVHEYVSQNHSGSSAR